MEGYLTSARKIDYCKNEWADIHLKPAFQGRRVGGNPLSAKNLGKNEWVGKPTRSTHFSEEEWVDTHSRLRIWAKRVGGNPLEALISAKKSGGNPLSAKNLGKTSGCQPTRIDYFDLNEWVYPLCKITYNGMNMPYNSIFFTF